MSIDAGATDCSTGLAKGIYDALLADATRNGFRGNTPPAAWQDMVRAWCYAIAAQVAAAHNADPPPPAKESFSAPTAADASSTTTGFADVSGLSFSIGANDVVAFEFVLPCYSAAGAGLKVQITGPAAPSLVSAAYETFDGSDLPVIFSVGAFSSAMVPTSSPAAVRLHRLRGIVRNGANAGTVQLQFASQNLSSVTLKAGAFVRYAKVG